MAVLYSIRDWEKHFEKSQSTRVLRASWVAVPNRHDGKSFRRLMRLDNGLEIYGAFHLIVQVASKCPKRGILADDDGPLSAEDISDKTGAPADSIQKAFDVCCDKSIGWMLCSECAPSVLRVRAEHAQKDLPTGITLQVLQDREDKTEHNNAPLGACSEQTKKRKPKEKFIQPTSEEVAAYCLERGKGVDPEAWMDHYESNGWKIGRNHTPMKNWQAAVRTWERSRDPANQTTKKPRCLTSDELKSVTVADIQGRSND